MGGKRNWSQVMDKTIKTSRRSRLLSPAGPAEPTRDQKQRRLVIKHENRFLLLDLTGGMKPRHGAGLGLYYNDTRFLSTWHWCLNGAPLQFLSGNADDGFACRMDYSNRADKDLRDQEVYVSRQLVINDELIEELKLVNFTASTQPLYLSLRLGSDWADMFEVRGSVRRARGQTFKPEIETPAAAGGSEKGRITLAYLGLDGIVRKTKVYLTGPAMSISATRVSFKIKLKPGQEATIRLRVETSEDKAEAQDFAPNFAPKLTSKTGYDWQVPESAASALTRARQRYQQWLASVKRIETGNAAFNQVVDQAYRDIYLLLQTTAGGRIPAAGLPWFAVAFGRDSLVLGLQTLPLMPELSRDILRTLAYYQGKDYDVETGCAPGRIMHELRPGEMARLGEIAFRPYYGTVDATPLWLWLLAEYVEHTGDLTLARKLWSNVRAALDYLDEEVDAYRLAFLTYGGRGDTALANQGWKDSGNCIVNKDGSLATAPIAVCEVQGYLYAAWCKIGRLAKTLGYRSLGNRLTLQAIGLKKRFNRHFYVAGENFYALALDGKGKRCEAVSSNPGHLLSTGILPRERAKAVAERLLKPDMFTGFGIRTLSSAEKAYQPMDYQVGSVWPHDNGFAVAGMAKLGLEEEAHQVLRALSDVAISQPDKRLPELFCGFERGDSKAPVPYPVACVPQVWAAGSILHMVNALIKRNAVPQWLGKVELIGPE